MNMFEMMQAARNPQQSMQALMSQQMQQWQQSDPDKFNQAQNMIRDKNHGELMNMARDLARQNGVNFEDVCRQFGIR